MKNIKKSEISLILKDADPQSIQGEVNVDKEKNEFSINVKGKFIVKEPKLMESKMSKEEMTQFSLIIKEAIEKTNKTVLSRLDGIEKTNKTVLSRLDGIEGRLTNLEKDMIEVKSDINKLKLDMIEVKTDIKAIKSTPTMKKELGL